MNLRSTVECLLSSRESVLMPSWSIYKACLVALSISCLHGHINILFIISLYQTRATCQIPLTCNQYHHV